MLIVQKQDILQVLRFIPSLSMVANFTGKYSCWQDFFFFFNCSAVQYCKLIMCVSEMLLKRDTRNYSTYASIHLFVYAEDLENASKEVKLFL